MLITGLLKAMGLLFPIYINSSTLSSESMSDELFERVKNPLENLAKPVSSLDWITKLLQHEFLLYSSVWPDCNHALVDLNDYNAHMDAKESIITPINHLFGHIMKSGSMADKVKALRAIDPFLNEKTAERLINTRLNDFEDLSAAIKSLAIDEIKAFDKNADNARALLTAKYNVSDMPATINLSNWFLINQCAFDLSFFEKFKREKITVISGIELNGDWVIGEIAKSQIVLRADVDLELLLFENMYRDYRYYDHGLVSRWYRYLVAKSSFRGAQLYDTTRSWKVVVRSLLLEDPKLAADTLDATLLFNSNDGKRNYLLLLRENPEKWLIRSRPLDIDEVYSCFNLGFNVKSFNYRNGIFHKISKEKHEELASYLTDLQKQSLMYSPIVDMQQRLSYLGITSLLKNGNNILEADYARRFTRNFKTLELLDVIGAVSIRALLVTFYMKAFNHYLLNNRNWDEAADEHFHYYISLLILENHRILANTLTEYLGISIELNNYRIGLIMNYCKSTCVTCTMEKVPRHLNSYFEIIEKPTQEELDPNDCLEIAIKGSIFSDENVGIIHKRDFVHYMFEERINDDLTKSPVFVDIARIWHNNENRKLKDITEFLYFEHLVCSYFPGLIRMNSRRGFQKISAKDTFSVALRALITENFENYSFPFALANLQVLEKELFKYNPEMALWLQLKTMPIKALLKAIYETLGDPCADLRLVLTRHLFNAQLSSKS